MYAELKQPLPLITPKGKGFAIAVIDYGSEHHLMFVTVIDDTGEIWTFSNPEVRVQPNATLMAKRVAPENKQP